MQISTFFFSFPFWERGANFNLEQKDRKGTDELIWTIYYASQANLNIYSIAAQQAQTHWMEATLLIRVRRQTQSVNVGTRIK